MNKPRISLLLIAFFACFGLSFQTIVDIKKHNKHEKYIDEMMSFRLSNPQLYQFR